jgi:hypothetical protein
MIGAPSDGRSYYELRDALGLIERDLPVHARLDRNLKFVELLKQVDVLTSDSQKWQESFSWDQVTGSSPHQTFFPLGFSYEQQDQKLSAGGVSFSVWDTFSCTECFKLRLSCVRRDDSLIVERLLSAGYGSGCALLHDSS